MAWNDDIQFQKRKKFYLFISDDNNNYYKADQNPDGSYTVTTQTTPLPIKNLPSNLFSTETEFATNKKYMSMNRGINFPLEFIKDGAAILRNFYYLGRGLEENAYITLVELNTRSGIYELSFSGKVDFGQKDEILKPGSFIVPLKDDSAWGLLSENDTVQQSINCSKLNKKSVRVLMDGITLVNRATFQSVAARIASINTSTDFFIPFVLVNQDGDSAGITLKNQNYSSVYDFLSQASSSTLWFFSTLYPIPACNIAGSFSFVVTDNPSPYSLQIIFTTSLGTTHSILNYTISTAPSLTIGQVISVNFDFNLSLASGENVFFIARMFGEHRPLVITPIVTNIVITVQTRPRPVVRYGLRAIDLGKELVNKSTKGRYTVDSDYLSTNNNTVCMSGDSLRGFKNAKLYSSFEDWFETFSALHFMALRDINGRLFSEKVTEVYKTTTRKISLGEAIDVKLSPALEYFFNEVEVGSPKQDYRHPSGRLEFNSTNTFALPLYNQRGKKSIVTKYRMGCYDSTFLLMDYLNESTKDNNGDKSVYCVQISNSRSTALSDVETFENISIDNALIEPIITSPLNDDTISYNKPIVRGISNPNVDVFIYVDNILDGHTISDANGKWSYQIIRTLDSFVVNFSSGVHIIEATFSDNSAPKTSISIKIDTSSNTLLSIIYPEDTDNLYNNKPLIEGVAQQGADITLSIDGVLTANLVADSSCKWSFKSPVLSNGSHVISVASTSLGTSDGVSVFVNTSVSHPLFTYIGGEITEFPITSNLPLIQGVAIPGTDVDIWINYISYRQLNHDGTSRIPVIADANGNWSYQVVLVGYADILSGQFVTISPIRNGLNIFSTSLRNYTVQIPVTGYTLDRPLFSSITGVIDNTVYNTAFSPKRMMYEHSPLWAAILDKQKNEKIYFRTADKNGNLSTTDLGAITVTENSDISYSELLEKFAILEIATIKVKTLSSFAKSLENFNNGGEVNVTFRGKSINMLCIGSMKMSNISSSVQEWKLLLSANNNYSDLLDLHRNGIKINLMSDEIYHSYYNSLHMVEYNYQRNPKYNSSELDEDWFSERNNYWISNPDYIQKYQTSETIKDQIVTNGIQNATLRMYRCSDAKVQAVIIYTVVSAPVPINHACLEAEIDFSKYPEGEYFFVAVVNKVPIFISERVSSKANWPNTMLIKASSSENLVDVFFSTGFKTIIRVEGMIKKLQAEVQNISAKDISGSSSLLYSMVSRKREFRFGTAKGLPDYLYLKIIEAIVLDELEIDNNEYSFGENSHIERSEATPGHPLFYYTTELDLKENPKGATFKSVQGAIIADEPVIIIGGRVFGLPAGSNVYINLTPP